MCITDDEFERSRAFIFLSEIKKKFLATYGLTAATALPYAMNTDFSRVLTVEMKTCNESREYDSISRVHGQIDELKDIMVKNIENITTRGERLELLVNKSENLRDNVSAINLILIDILNNRYLVFFSVCFIPTNIKNAGENIVLA
jgi:vesicle-associated membrane protein 7